MTKTKSRTDSKPILLTIRILNEVVSQNNTANKVRDAADSKLLEYIAKL